MNSTLASRLRTFCLGTALALGAVGAAQAGAVSVNFDPSFGPPLANVDYSGNFGFAVSNSCVGSGTGWVAVTAARCGGAVVGTGSLTLSDNGNSPITAPLSLAVDFLYVMNGFVTGWVTDSSPVLTQFRSISGGSDFLFGFVDLPTLVALYPCQLFSGCEIPYAISSLNGFVGDVTYLNDSGRSPLGNDANGNPIGYQITVDANGNRSVTPMAFAAVPEPGSLALVSVALFGAFFHRQATREVTRLNSP